MADSRAKADKMRAVANAESASDTERGFARRWLTSHGEPVAPPPPPFTRRHPPRAHPPRSDAARRREEMQHEAAARREADARFRRETEGVNRDAFTGFGASEDPGFDFDDFLAASQAAFAEGFAEALKAQPIFRPHTTPPEYMAPTPEARRARAEEERLRRQMADEMKAAKKQARHTAQDRLREMRERDASSRIDRDEGGNPIYRRAR